MFGKVEGMGGIFLHPWQVWNPEDLEKPDHRQIAIFSVAQGSERTTPDQIKKYLDFVYNQGNYPFLFISVPEGNASPVAEGSLAQAFSLSKIQSLPGNDPADNPFIDLTIQAAAADPEGDQDLWQWHYYIPMSSSLQNYLWLADLTKY